LRAGVRASGGGPLVDGRTEQLPELLPDLTHFLLAPYIGDKQAAKITTDN
jgi:hypothetical protein